MEEKILENIENPEALEFLFRQNSDEFRNAFPAVFQKYPDQILLQAWHYRLKSDKKTLSWGTRREQLTLGVLAILLIPILHIVYFPDDDTGPTLFRNVSFVWFGAVSIYFLIRSFIYKPFIWVPFLVFTIIILFINSNIVTSKNPTYSLIQLHIPVLLWMIAGIAFSIPNTWSYKQWLGYLKYNGDWLVLTTLLTIAGFLLIILTHALFGLINVKLHNVLGERFFIWVSLITPLVSAWLTLNNPQLVGQISPAIARIFAPLLTLSVLAFLVVLGLSGQSLFNDRNLLLIFNILILGVLAITVFSLTGDDIENYRKSHLWLIQVLLLITLILNAIALMGILFRISTWGITPNRLAVMGINFLMMIHLTLIGYSLLVCLVQGKSLRNVGKAVVKFLPFYTAWILLVVFVFPLVFQ